MGRWGGAFTARNIRIAAAEVGVLSQGKRKEKQVNEAKVKQDGQYTTEFGQVMAYNVFSLDQSRVLWPPSCFASKIGRS